MEGARHSPIFTFGVLLHFVRQVSEKGILMMIIRVFPRKTSFTPKDELAFIGDPPLFRPPADEVHVSVTFTWDIEEGKRLQAAWAQYYPVVKIGGPAFGNVIDEFITGRYVKPGVTFTTQGCNNHCPWCLVPQHEGRLIEIGIFAPGHIVQDNNILQASQQHVERVFDMLRSQRKAAIFSGGLQASLVDKRFCDLLRSIHVESIFLAADTPGSLKMVEDALRKLSFLKRRQLRVYCMIGRSETIEKAKDRLQRVWDMGGLPFAQLYQPPERRDYSRKWKELVREWSRPAAIFANHKQG